MENSESKESARTEKSVFLFCFCFFLPDNILCVQGVVAPIYIVTHYINWGNYFLDTQYSKVCMLFVLFFYHDLNFSLAAY